MSAADMQYTVGTVVFVRFRHKDNQVGIMHHDDSNLLPKFRKFCERLNITSVGGGVSGPSTHMGYYTFIAEEPTIDGKPATVEDLAAKIIEWFEENGATAKQEY